MLHKLKTKAKKTPLVRSLMTLGMWIQKKVCLMRIRRKYKLMTRQMYLLDPAENKRAKYWKRCGVHTSGNFRVGYGVYFDAANAEYITIEDGVWITSQCLLLCHRRNIDNYALGDDYNSLPYKKEPITLKRGCCVGMRSIIMPGVTVGEGAIVGAGSLVSKDIPPYTLAVGRPAKVVKVFSKR